MIKKVYLILESPFSVRDYKRLGIETLQRRGFEVAVWDLSKVFHPQLTLTPPDPVDFEGLRVFKSKQEVIAAARELSAHDMILTWFVYPRFFWLYRLISRSKAYYSSIFLVTVPYNYNEDNNYAAKKSFFHRFLKLIKAKPWELLQRAAGIKNRIFTSIPYKLFGIKPITFWFAATAITRKVNLFPCDKNTRTEYIHVYDYDLYLEKQKEKPASCENNAVFLDVYFPFHEDNGITGSTPLVTAEKYYPSLCKFFDYTEKEQDVKVTIAAHPRSHYDEHPDYFNKRTLLVGRTDEMVRDAKFVISHNSASFNFAIMYYKPIIFIVTGEMGRHNNLTEMIYNMAAWLGKEPINIDEPLCIDWKKELSINKEKYDTYIETFIKMRGTEQLNSWEIVADRLTAHRG
ncbi:MAG: hypothetical protein A2293_13765 [Elusimicrobia bacterium RIFOXYB2_FULL_49_7]|nr:MAG: hypothetical protein A2293_13765 [Elusimicrobia bacterium RIFOXYB2_FULL_49_7]